jgi:hypothetical protein
MEIVYKTLEPQLGPNLCDIVNKYYFYEKVLVHLKSESTGPYNTPTGGYVTIGILNEDEYQALFRTWETFYEEDEPYQELCKTHLHRYEQHAQIDLVFYTRYYEKIKAFETLYGQNGRYLLNGYDLIEYLVDYHGGWQPSDEE